tara:strand:- start:287 stop:832 length:546 start_codon:yes stop_codon:yes gene_type:complete
MNKDTKEMTSIEKLNYFRDKLKKEEEKCIALIENEVENKIKKIKKEMKEKEREREEIEEDVVNYPGHPGSTSGLRIQWGEEDDFYREQIQALKESIEENISEVGYERWKEWNEGWNKTVSKYKKNPSSFDRKLSDILVEDYTIPQLFTDLYEDDAEMDKDSWYEAWDDAIKSENSKMNQLC